MCVVLNEIFVRVSHMIVIRSKKLIIRIELITREFYGQTTILI